MNDIAARLEPLLRSVVPAFVDILANPNDERAGESGRAAVRSAAEWFLPGIDTAVLRGHELDSLAVDQAFRYEFTGLNLLEPHRVSCAEDALQLLAGDIWCAWRREIHSPGWIRPMAIPESRAQQILRADVHHLITTAVFALTGDLQTRFKGQKRVPGCEFDIEKLMAVLAEDMAGDTFLPTETAP